MALRQSIVILRGLFSFLVRQNYLIGNAFAGVASPRETGRVWDHDARSPSSSGARSRSVSRRLGTTPSAAGGRGRCAAVCDRPSPVGNGQRTVRRLALGRLPAARRKDGHGWLLSVVGKGDKLREVPVPVSLVEELQEDLGRHGSRRT